MVVWEKEGGQGETLDVCPSYTGPNQKILSIGDL